MSFIPKQFPLPGTGAPSLVYALRVWEWTGTAWRIAIDQPTNYQQVDPGALAASIPILLQTAQSYLARPPPYLYLQLLVVGPLGNWLPVFSRGNWETA